MLRSLLSSHGVNPQMITVFIDGYYEVLYCILLNAFFSSPLLWEDLYIFTKWTKGFLVRNPWMWWISSVLKEFSICLSVLRMLECHRWYVCDFCLKMNNLHGKEWPVIDVCSGQSLFVNDHKMALIHWCSFCLSTTKPAWLQLSICIQWVNDEITCLTPYIQLHCKTVCKCLTLEINKCFRMQILPLSWRKTWIFP